MEDYQTEEEMLEEQDKIITEILNELYSNISHHTQLGEINYDNIPLLVHYFIEQGLGGIIYEELQNQLNCIYCNELY